MNETPTEPTTAREREIWTDDERRLLERTAKLMRSRGLRMFLQCVAPTCEGQPAQRVPQGDGTIVIRCNHLDRQMQRTF